MKKALVTGATRGIGRAICIELLEQGYEVHGTFFSSIDEAKKLQETYPGVLYMYGPYDFRVISDIYRLVGQLREICFDTLILNAGMFSENDDFLEFDLSTFNETMNCNFYAPLILCAELRENIKSMGSIVLMSSNDAYPGAFGSISYSVSKSAIISLMRCMCVNYGSKGIRVNSVAPGAIDTDMNTPEQEFEAPEYTPLGRIGRPYEVADVVAFLASEKSSFINGENITIDGGYSIVSILLKNEAKRIRSATLNTQGE